ncbi:MAG: formylglycine-generating enzyme family protein, partial [Candidatus Competibacterales bacterium]
TALPAAEDLLTGWPPERVAARQRHAAQVLGFTEPWFRDPVRRGRLSTPWLVVIPPGRFIMGSPQAEVGRRDDERPRTVTLSRPVALGRFAVTREEYNAYCRAIGRPSPPESGDGRWPVTGVSWFDAVAYAHWLSEQTGQPYRLPTEAEWEYACRAGAATAFWWGATASPSVAHYGQSPLDGQPRVVSAFDPNPWGLHQVHGNVGEWVADNYCADPRGLPDRDPLLDDGGERRIFRGGGWSSPPAQLRAACRLHRRAQVADGLVGFRLARELA